MSLAVTDVKRIAHLARLAISDHEAHAMVEQLNSILRLIEQMQAVDTQGIEPMSHAQDVVLRLRGDRVTEGDEHELFQRLAPQVEAGLYLVPKVIE